MKAGFEYRRELAFVCVRRFLLWVALPWFSSIFLEIFLSDRR